MKVVFADSFFYFALFNRRDRDHAKALQFVQSHTGRYVTTPWVLTEVGDGMSAPGMRGAFASLFDDLNGDANVTVVPCSDVVFRAGVERYRRRPDKDWSLTDCISFVVMEGEGITDALTGDHHFEQAGFNCLLK